MMNALDVPTLPTALPNAGSVRAWLLATRPKTLTAALVPIAVGTALAHGMRISVHPGLSGLALLSSFLIQIGTNFINDAMDFKKGADNEERLGPVRATASGLLSHRAVWCAGILAFIAASLVALPLLRVGGWPILFIGAASVLAGYLYTGGPYPLAYRGLGDLFVLIFFGWVAVMGMAFLQGDSWSFSAWIAGTQVGLLSVSLIAINNLRDHIGDRKSGKKTLAVRLGVRKAKGEILVSLGLPYILGGYWGFAADRSWAMALPMLSLPLAVKLMRSILRTDPGTAYNRFLAKAAGVHLTFGILLAIGLWVAY